MKARINAQSDPISLIILAADGNEHKVLEGAGHDAIIDVEITGAQSSGAPATPVATPPPGGWPPVADPPAPVT